MLFKGVIYAFALFAVFPLVLGSYPLVETIRNFITRWRTINVYDFRLLRSDGEIVTMAQYEGDTLMIINLPFNCDPKRIYNLNALMAHYYTRGLRILGFPTDEFSPAYPIEDRFDSLARVSKYVQKNVINFYVFNKIRVNGPHTHQLWNYLKASQDLNKNSIIEDYTFFIVNKRGVPVKRISGNHWSTYEELVILVYPYL